MCNGGTKDQNLRPVFATHSSFKKNLMSTQRSISYNRSTVTFPSYIKHEDVVKEGLLRKSKIKVNITFGYKFTDNTSSSSPQNLRDSIKDVIVIIRVKMSTTLTPSVFKMCKKFQ